MALSDREIERYSRQIILPEIGGRGQERLLAAVVAVAGAGPLAATAARYLVGAGVGELRLESTDGQRLARELRALNPDVTVRTGGVDATATVALAADLAVEALDEHTRQTRALGVPMVAAAARGAEGWIVAGGGCASCAARAARWTGPADAAEPLAPIATGVLGSLLALAVLELVLGHPGAPPLRCFDARSAALTPGVLTRTADCGGCAPHRSPGAGTF